MTKPQRPKFLICHGKDIGRAKKLVDATCGDGSQECAADFVSPQCERCVYYESILGPMAEWGLCRRYAPKGEFPRVLGKKDWCGEFSPMEVVEVDHSNEG